MKLWLGKIEYPARTLEQRVYSDRRIILAFLAGLLLLLAQPVWAIKVDGAQGAAASSDVSTTAQSGSNMTLTVPSGGISLKLSYLPELGTDYNKLLAGRSFGESFAFTGATPLAASPLPLRGTGQLQADYKPSDALQMSLTYEHAAKALAGSTQAQMSSTLGYSFALTPSANSRLTAGWKLLQTEQPGGQGANSSQSTELGYEMKFAGGLMRLNKKMLLSSANSQETKQDESTMHLEWGRSGKFSLAADYWDKAAGQTTDQGSSLAGKLLLTPKTNFAFNLRRQEISGNPDTRRMEMVLNSDLGTKKAPLKLLVRSVSATQGELDGQSYEANLQGGFTRAGLGVKFAGLLRNQTGTVDGREPGELRSLQVETQYSRLKLLVRQENFTPAVGVACEKQSLDSRFALSKTLSLLASRHQESGLQNYYQDEYGLSQKLGAVELTASRINRASLTDEQSWDSLRAYWKFGPSLPAWAKSLGEAPLLFTEANKYGFAPTPVWGKVAPGLEVSWRRRAGGALDGADSMRLIYRGLLGGVHLRGGVETNPWSGLGSAEQVSLGRRDFLEVGLPISGKFTGLARFSQCDGANGAKGIFLSLAGKISAQEKWECFFSNEPQWLVADGYRVAHTDSPTYGLIYSRNRSEQNFLNLKASFNPPISVSQTLEEWRLDMSFSQPF